MSLRLASEMQQALRQIQAKTKSILTNGHFLTDLFTIESLVWNCEIKNERNSTNFVSMSSIAKMRSNVLFNSIFLIGSSILCWKRIDEWSFPRDANIPVNRFTFYFWNFEFGTQVLVRCSELCNNHFSKFCSRFATKSGGTNLELYAIEELWLIWYLFLCDGCEIVNLVLQCLLQGIPNTSRWWSFCEKQINDKWRFHFGCWLFRSKWIKGISSFGMYNLT